MSAADDLVNAFGGVQGDGKTPLSWRPVYVRARTVLSNILKRTPFSWPTGNSPSTTSTFDQIEGTAEQIAWRYVDSKGVVWDQKSVMLVLVEMWNDRIDAATMSKYRTAADVLRPWPTGFPGAFPGEPQQDYPKP